MDEPFGRRALTRLIMRRSKFQCAITAATATAASLRSPRSAAPRLLVEVLAQDKQYAEWLTAQPWFRDKFAGLYTVIINKFQEPSETPEHAE